MLSLFYTILSIALLASMLFASVQYLAPGQQLTTKTYTLADKGFTSLAQAYSNYVQATTVAPGLSTWQTDLTPKYVFLPQTPASTAWSYGTDGVGHWFCLSGTVSQPQYAGMAQLSQIYSVQQYFLGASCGATTNSAAPATFPAPLYATYWVTAP